MDALTKCMEKKLGGNYTSMLRAILNRSWGQYLTKQQLYGHQPPIMKNIKIRWTRHVGHYWRSKEEFISEVFVAASHQTRLDTRSKARRPIKVGIKGRGRSGTSRDSNPACLCCSSAHLVQCEPDEASSFTNPNVGPGTYASLQLKLDAWSSAVHGGQRRQKCSSPTRR